MAHRLTIPGTTYIGENALADALADISALGKHALIVSGNSMKKAGHLEMLTARLQESGVSSTVFSGITGEPTDIMVENGTALYRECGADFIIGFGGGSQLDAAKAIGILASNPGSISDCCCKPIPASLPPLVAIPTTSGTGSEATDVTIITDTANDVKMLIKNRLLMPDIAVVDAIYSMNAPESVTVATGLDALTHAIEAYTSVKAFPESDIFALSAVKRIFSFLPAAVADGTDKNARTQMAMAAYAAGISFCNSSVTVVHGMSRPIGAIFHVPHGISNAMLLDECMKYVVSGAYDRFAGLARAIGVAGNTTDDIHAASSFIDAVSEICKVYSVPSFREYGIDEDRYFSSIEKMSSDAIESGSPANTRMPLSKEDISTIYKNAWK